MLVEHRLLKLDMKQPKIMSMIWPIYLQAVTLKEEAVPSEKRKIGNGNSSASLLYGWLQCLCKSSRRKIVAPSLVNSIASPPLLLVPQSNYLLMIWDLKQKRKKSTQVNYYVFSSRIWTRYTRILQALNINKEWRLIKTLSHPKQSNYGSYTTLAIW